MEGNDFFCRIINESELKALEIILLNKKYEIIEDDSDSESKNDIISPIVKIEKQTHNPKRSFNNIPLSSCNFSYDTAQTVSTLHSKPHSHIN